MVRAITCMKSDTNSYNASSLDLNIPRSKVDTVNLLRLRESESRSKEREEAGSDGQKASHCDRKRGEW